MATYEVSVNFIVEAEDDSEAYYMVEAAVDNMTAQPSDSKAFFGGILRAHMGDVQELDQTVTAD